MTSGGHGAAGPRVVVTGSTRGLGLAVARRLTSGGARVVVNGTDRDRCALVAKELDVPFVCGRVEASGVAQELIDVCVDRFGGVDAVVNNAGMTRDAMLTRMTRDELHEVLSVHVEGAWAMCQAAVRAMKTAGHGGALVNVTSGTGLFGNPGQSNYAAAKGAVLGLTRALSLELARFGIDVNAVAPTVKTDMTAEIAARLESEDVGEYPVFGEPDAVAALFEYLCSPASRGMTGQILSFDGHALATWSHPRAVAATADESWSLDQFGSVLRDSANWQPLNPDRLGRILQGL